MGGVPPRSEQRYGESHKPSTPGEGIAVADIHTREGSAGARLGAFTRERRSYEIWQTLGGIRIKIGNPLIELYIQRKR